MDKRVREPFKRNSRRGDAQHKTKKTKMMKYPTVRVLTFALSHSPVQVQLLESNTVFDLVKVICKKTTVGLNESVYDHMWDVFVPGISGKFNSTDEYVDSDDSRFDEDGPVRKASRTKLKHLGLTNQTKLRLEYDYGSTSKYTITLIRSEHINGNQDILDTFPRAKPIARPPGYTEFETNQVDMNAMFPKLNKFITKGEMVAINLFRPGRKKNFGYWERHNWAIMHMIFLPVKPGKDLSDYFHTFNCASPPSHLRLQHSWLSMVALPNEYNKDYGSYGKYLKKGFVELTKASQNYKSPLNSVFPKVAALAGYKKDKKVPQGWISYKDSVLMICSGSARAREVQCRAPPGTAFYGEDQHQPESPDDILFQHRVRIKSLHHLLCVSEGLLRTLK